MSPAQVAAELVRTPLFGITLTVVVFAVGQKVFEASGRRMVLHPVLLAIVLGVGVLLALGIEYRTFMTGGAYVAFLLGPATVALALPLHRNSGTVVRSAPMVLIGLALGAAAAIGAGYLVTRWLAAPEAIARSMAPKSATTPIAIALAEQTGGIPALAAVFAVLAGVLGAIAGPAVLTLARIRDPRARGLALGMASHGVGTARALADDEETGAFAGIGMALGGLLTSVLLGAVLGALGVAAQP